MNNETPDRCLPRQRRWRGWIVVVALLAAGVGWIFRPYFHADESLIDPRLRALKKPFQSVELTVFFDGGSSGVFITDAAGKTESFFIPCDEPHPKVYLMASSETRVGEVPATNH
ncbi:MAG TPA: hypothetical protein VHM91_16210, partial [Verrucomicrobiales bacterium]|nr:hypothetical protein [Verrucomicrobiales bacterium]